MSLCGKCGLKKNGGKKLCPQCRWDPWASGTARKEQHPDAENAKKNKSIIASIRSLFRKTKEI